MTFIPADSELGQSVDVSIGPDASPSNPVSMTIFCSNFSVMDDIYKEGEEFLRLNLTTLDSQVCLGRDLALVQIPANDRKLILCKSLHVRLFSLPLHLLI